MIHREGRRLVDSQGRPVILRGVNLGGCFQWEGWKLGRGYLTKHTTIIDKIAAAAGPEQARRFREGMYAAWITEADIAAIASFGFNMVRIPLHWDSLEPQVPVAAWPYLDKMLEWCERHQVWAVLDLHAAPGGQSMWPPTDPGPRAGRLWRSPEAQDRTVALWRAIAARYCDREIVAGYDLLNEPWPPSGAVLTAFYARVIAAIREVDPSHLVIVEGGKFGFDLHHIERVLDENLALSFHMYTWFNDTRRQYLKRYVEQAARQDLPLWCGEFGENSYQMIESTVEMFEDPAVALSGWAFWTWKRAPAWFPGLQVVAVPPNWGRLINWIGGWFTRKPTAEVAVRGIDEFLDAVAHANTTLDQTMLKALRGRR